jgi:hypothetical protein
MAENIRNQELIVRLNLKQSLLEFVNTIKIFPKISIKGGA